LQENRRALSGTKEEVLAQVRELLERERRISYRAMGSGEYREQLAIVGETPNIAARLQEHTVPNAVLDEALAAVHGTGEPYCAADLYRLKGQLTLQSKVPSPKQGR